MRPLRLDLAGFTVFRDETTIDFTDADFFALVGPTGSGKSTVLDAICFALYGTVPRWGDRRAIGNALAPSATEARVRLVFESAGSRYVATRVVRRDGKGRVSTGAAGLELLPPGFDVRRFDTGLRPEDLGEVLAGTPAEMDAAVLHAVGLPYEQFTSCVVLPQGEFAEFLHAKPATRQQILVNLLGLGAYEQVRERANARAGAADARLAATDRLLDGAPELDDTALDAAEERVAAATALTDAVESAMPRLRTALDGTAEARAALAALDEELATLDALRPPADLAAVCGKLAQARKVAAEAADAVADAEDREEKLRGELSTAGDPGTLRLLLKEHTERERVTGQAASIAEALGSAEGEHTRAVAALAEARQRADAAADELEAARSAYQDAQTADRAAALRAHLAHGEPCPVCEQPVAAVPAMPAGSAVPAAEAAGKLARRAAEEAKRVLGERDEAVRELDRTLAAARGQHEHVTAALSELDARLADSPAPEALRRELATIDGLRHRVDEAATAVRAAREAHRRGSATVGAAEDGVRRAWQRFDAVRDTVSGLKPPATDRDDLATAWAALQAWARAQADQRRSARGEAATAVTAAEAAVQGVRDELTGLFAGIGLPVPRDDEFARDAAVAASRAESHRDELVRRREEAAKLHEQRETDKREAEVARALATHLRANNFERWLLEEALDVLVDGASRILRELTGGQYDLTHTKGEFFVLDHHDAGLRRGVRTLSGGETFQASLALALALSEQLAGLSTNAASLEAIVLDEGFGTLDAATLDTVAATLENLASRGDRMVGVVTHVGSLAERVPVRFEVRKSPRGSRVERVGF